MPSEAGGRGFESRRAHKFKSSDSFRPIAAFFSLSGRFRAGCTTDVPSPVASAQQARRRVTEIVLQRERWLGLCVASHQV